MSLYSCTLTEAEYEEVCEETLQSLADRFEDLAEGSLDKDDYDLQYAVSETNHTTNHKLTLYRQLLYRLLQKILLFLKKLK